MRAIPRRVWLHGSLLLGVGVPDYLKSYPTGAMISGAAPSHQLGYGQEMERNPEVRPYEPAMQRMLLGHFSAQVLACSRK